MDCDKKAGKDWLLKLADAPAFKALVEIQGLKYLAVTPGVAGNTITFTYVDSAAGGLVVSVTATDIEVDFGGDTPTNTEIMAAVNAFAAAAALVLASVFGCNLAKAQVLQVQTSLQDGHAAITVETTIGGLRSTSLSINSEEIDATSHDSEQFKELLEGAGITNFAISGAGIMSSKEVHDYLRRLVIEKRFATFHIIDVTASKKFIGVMKMASLERAGDYNNEQTYTMAINSSGEVLYVAA